jgi:hypothetical protein
LGVCLAIGLAIAFMACASVAFDNTLMNSNVPITDHAVLYFDTDVKHPLIDNDIVTDKENAIVMLTPGVHSISAMVADVSFKPTVTTVTTSGFMTVSQDFVAGFHYYIEIAKSGKNISLKITDETNPTSTWDNDAEQKRAEKRIVEARSRINNVTYPKQTALSISYSELWNNAIKADATPFEGIWNGQEKNSGSYRFQGNTYYFSPIGNLSTISLADHEGVFEYTDNTITFTTLREVYMGMCITTGLVNTKQKKEAYTYTLNDGTFVLSSGAKTIGTFTRK